MPMPFDFSRRQILSSAAGAAAASFLAAPAMAESWRPKKAVRVIVGDTAGGGTDGACRVFTDFLSKTLGQTFIVDNKPGANGVVAATELKNSDADGYTLLYLTSSALMTQKTLYKSLPYDPFKDFRAVGACPVAGLPLVVHNSTGAKTLKEFIEYAKKNPTNIGTYGAGSMAHIGVAAIQKNYDVQVTPVHYRGGAPMWTDLAAGVVQGAIGSNSGGKNVVDAGKGTAVAILGQHRLLLQPEVPTFKELGATEPGLLLMGYTCMMAPVGVPDNIVEAYSQAMVAAGHDEPTWQRFLARGNEQKPIGHAELQKWITDGAPVWTKLTQGLGITPS
jgi:tripartite-type tricarboxylate transporter receptor subunit TctC